MRDITVNEMNFVLTLLKNPTEEFNSRNIAEKIEISHMGSFKIAKKLEKEGIIVSKKIGRGTYYRLDLERDYVKQYIKFLIKREAEQAHPYVKRWLNELKKIAKADIIVLFGSVLIKHGDSRDVDVLLVTDNKKFNLLKKEVDAINLINQKKVHPLYQNKEDLKNNIIKGDKVIINALRGIVVFGEDILLEIIK